VLRRCRLLCVCSCDPRLLPLSFVFWIFKFPMRPFSRFLRRLCDIPAVFNHKLSVVTLTDTLKPVRPLPSLSRFFEATRECKSDPEAYSRAVAQLAYVAWKGLIPTRCLSIFRVISARFSRVLRIRVFSSSRRVVLPSWCPALSFLPSSVRV